MLGTDGEEIARLGVQHNVWRPRMLDAWRRAGVTTGQTIIDLGAGPGYAALDLAEIVGKEGHVMAVERSQNFLNALEEKATHRKISNISCHCVDIDLSTLDDLSADVVWCRWLLSFVTAPRSTVQKISNTLRSEGIAVFHEYLDYGTWKHSPPIPEVETFVTAVMSSWRDTGGEPDIGRWLPGFLADAGFEILDVRPLIDVVAPSSFVWQWPAGFIEGNLDRLVEADRLSLEQASATRNSLARAEASANSLVTTPCVLEVIARRL